METMLAEVLRSVMKLFDHGYRQNWASWIRSNCQWYSGAKPVSGIKSQVDLQ